MLAPLVMLLATAAQEPSSPPPETAALSVRAAVGVRIPYTLELRASRKFKQGAETTESTTVAEQSFELEALEVAADGATVFAIHFGHAKGSAKIGGSGDTFDSDKPAPKAFHPILDGDPLAQGMLRRAGKTARATVAPDGTVGEVQGLPELDADLKKLAGLPAEMEVQELFALLPGTPVDRRTKWTGSYAFTPMVGTTVAFRPDCAATEATDEAIAWSIKSPAIGSAGARSKPPPPKKGPAARGKTKAEAWSSDSWTVDAAAIAGSARVAASDGLLLKGTIEWSFELLYGDLPGDSRTYSSSVRRRVEVVRR